MDDSRFDAWTRRQFGLATGGALAAALGLAAVDAAEAKRKKRRKKRCRKIHQTCTPPGSSTRKKKRCCKGLTCNDETNDPDVGACCRYFQRPCQSESQCCLSFECQQAVGLQGKRCCSPFGVFCRELSDCCAGDGVICHPLYNCCRRVQASCAAENECCGTLLCELIPALGGLHCCAGDGGDCEVGNDCCNELNCIDGSCKMN